MKVTSLSLLVFAVIALILNSCGLGENVSYLAVYEGSEAKFTSEACRDSSSATARMSKMKIGSLDLVLYNSNYCSSYKKGKRSLTSGFGLQGPTQVGRKPVMVVYGYAGNASSDQVEHQGVNDIMPWVQQNFRPVVIQPGANISQAQQAIMNDRRNNPQDYANDSWVGTIIASHGYQDNQTGDHRIIQSNVSSSGRSAASYRTTDVQKALLEGIGHDAGTVYCMTWACQSGAAMQDPKFESLKNSPINPDQKRVFQFSSAADKLAGFSDTMTPQGSQITTPAEKSLVFATQNVDPSAGLTVGELQKKLNAANLGTSGGFDISTVYTPNGGLSDTGEGFGTPSHNIAQLYYSPQGPTVVGANDAYVFPPGVEMNSTIPPVTTEKEIIDFNRTHLPDNTFANPNVEIAPPQYSPNSPYYGSGEAPIYSGEIAPPPASANLQ